MDALFYGAAVLLFAAVILLIEGAYLWWIGTHGSEARRIARRLRIMSDGAAASTERVSILKQRNFSKYPALDRLLHRLRLARQIDKVLVQAGVRWSVAQFIGSTLALVAVGLLLGQAWNGPGPVQALAVALAAIAPWLLLIRSRTARMRRIEAQLAEAADFIARALRAGHSFSNVMQMVGSELPMPLSGEFRKVHEEINYGVPLNDALHNLAERIPLTDLRYMVIAVVIQRESGGNLAEILGNISYIIRERLKLIGQVRVLSAEGRMSAWILGLLPFVVVGVMSIAHRQYISLLWTEPAGIRLMWWAAGMIVIGVLWLKNTIHIRV